MLERLARWLRVLGYDVLSANLAGPEAEALLAKAASQGRIILTRNRQLAVPGLEGDILFVDASSPLHQLSHVLAQLHLHGPWRLFTRCLICNAALLPAPTSPPTSGSPASPLDTAPRHCPHCGRQYWEGVHTRRMRAALKRALGPGFAELAG